MHSNTILHIEDRAYWHVLVSQSLQLLPGGCEVRATITGREGIASCRQLEPDLVILDLVLPDMDGFELANELASLCSPPRLLILTVRLDHAALHRVSTSPVDGMIWKNSRNPLREIRQATAAVLNDETYFSSDVRDAIVTMKRNSSAFFKILSPREVSLLPYLGRGLTDSEVADACRSSVVAIHSCRKRIMAKLDIHCRQELMAWCSKEGFCSIN